MISYNAVRKNKTLSQVLAEDQKLQQQKAVAAVENDKKEQ